MSIRIDCPGCRSTFNLPDRLTGGKIRCKECGETLDVPAAPTRAESAPRQRIRSTAPKPILPREQPRPNRTRRAEGQSGGGGPLIAVLLAGGAALALLLLVALAVGGWFLLSPSSRSGGPAASASASTSATADVAEADTPPLRYRWAGAPLVYHVRVEIDRADFVEVHEGNCTVQVNPRVPRGPAGLAERKASGTGFVVNADGYLVTCAHVADGATKIDVTIGGRSYPAKVVAVNQAADLALLQITAQGLPTLSLAESDGAEVGQDVWALGYPLSTVLGQNLKASRGTLSGVNSRAGRKVFQIDAAVNAGNSGGPVVTETGLVLGVTHAKLAGGDISNVGFATPANDVKRLLNSKRVSFSTDGWDARLDGPTLVKRVSAATAFIQVALGAGAGADSYVLSGQGALQKTQRPKPGAAFMPPFPEFPRVGTTRVEVDSSGEILQSSGGIQMPFMLGDVVQFMVDPLSDEGRDTWETTSRCTIEEGSSSPRGRPFGPMGLPGLPGLPGMPGRPFGPPGGFPGFPGGGIGGPGNGRQTTTRIGDEHTTYTREGTVGDAVTIRKHYELKVPANNPAQSALNLSLDGAITFDSRQGLPRTIDITGSLTITSGNTTQRIPLTVNYQLQQGGGAAPAAPAVAGPAGPAVPVAPPPGGGPAAAPNPAPPPAPTRLVGDVPPVRPPEVSVPLPAPAGAVAVGGAGRFLILHLPVKKQLAVFDVKEGRMVKTLAAADDKILFAAGRDRLIAFSPATNQFLRWRLPSFEPESSVPNPVAAEIRALAMGSASDGPLFVLAPAQGHPVLGLRLHDPATLKPLPDMVEPIKDQFFGAKIDSETPALTCSADGRVALLRSEFRYISLCNRGGTWRNFSIGNGAPLASADGQVIIDHGQAFSPEGEALGPKRGGHGVAVWCIPAAAGGLTVSFNEAYVKEGEKAYIKLMLHIGANPEPLVTLPRKIDDATWLIDWLMGRPKRLERYVFLVPEFAAFVLIPADRSRIDIYRTDLDQILKEAKRDYLFIASEPLLAAVKGKEYRSALLVKSSKGGLKFTLQTAPPGMQVSADGTLTWKPPADFAAPQAEVVLAIGDASGQEIPFTFSIRVREP